MTFLSVATMTEPVVRVRDRSFGPTVLIGLAGATLAAVAGTRDWVTASGDAAGINVDAALKGSESAPLVAALALVALAAWGVVLVLRGRVRRIVSVVGALASVGALGAVIDAYAGVQNDAADAVIDKGATGDVFVASLTTWYYLAGVGALVAFVAFVVAARQAPGWPEMGSRYDAPGGRADMPEADEDMWRALDEGRDPTS